MAGDSSSVFDFCVSRPWKIRKRAAADSSVSRRLWVRTGFHRDHRADFIASFASYARRFFTDARFPGLDFIFRVQDSRDFIV